MEIIQKKYFNLITTPSDINEHLPTLFSYAMQCESIIELGVRGCVSSWALVYGLLNNNSNRKQILLSDLAECDITELLQYTTNTNVRIEYIWINDLDLQIMSNVDLTFIDTWHVYGQLKRELNKFSKCTNKYIIMHDTTVDAIDGETIRNNWNALEQSKQSGIPVEEINCGLWKAVEEFLQENNNWVLHMRFTNNNGLTILKKIN
jgi:hypothetical protein